MTAHNERPQILVDTVEEWPYNHLHFFLDGTFTWHQDPRQLPHRNPSPLIASIILENGEISVQTFDPTTGERIDLVDVMIGEPIDVEAPGPDSTTNTQHTRSSSK